VYKARVMAARAIRPLLSTEHFTVVLSMLLDNLKTNCGAALQDTDGQNLIHGSLLQVISRQCWRIQEIIINLAFEYDVGFIRLLEIARLSIGQQAVESQLAVTHQ